MDSVAGFFLGLGVWFGFVFAIPIAMALMLGVIALFAKLTGYKEQVAPMASWLAFDPELAYAPGHTWLKQSGERMRVGLDDLALRLLPNVASVKGAEAGRSVAAGETLFVLRLGSVEVSIPSPINGKVTAANDDGASDLKKNWLVELEPAGDAYKSLPRGEAAREWLTSEAGRLVGFAERELGLAAADGGEVSIHSVDSVPADKWNALLKDFLKVEPKKA
ncbi:MAG TPA: hypothetical protein VGK67_10025 [Myxococcales bacterium]|jgi:glycine cleavage system H lipoate-binding protein